MRASAAMASPRRPRCDCCCQDGSAIAPEGPAGSAPRPSRSASVRGRVAASCALSIAARRAAARRACTAGGQDGDHMARHRPAAVAGQLDRAGRGDGAVTGSGAAGDIGAQHQARLRGSSVARSNGCRRGHRPGADGAHRPRSGSRRHRCSWIRRSPRAGRAGSAQQLVSRWRFRAAVEVGQQRGRYGHQAASMQPPASEGRARQPAA